VQHDGHNKGNVALKQVQHDGHSKGSVTLKQVQHDGYNKGNVALNSFQGLPFVVVIAMPLCVHASVFVVMVVA
ncbi:MAG: hypothetical protein LBO62_07135, partial [Endomicrobium sp.]|nr:hypothetical protein [Endomicrobium sp.]